MNILFKHFKFILQDLREENQHTNELRKIGLNNVQLVMYRLGEDQERKCVNNGVPHLL